MINSNEIWKSERSRTANATLISIVVLTAFLLIFLLQNPNKTIISAVSAETGEDINQSLNDTLNAQINDSQNNGTNASINNPPIMLKEISNYTINYGEEITLNLSEYFYDPDNDTIVYSAVSTQNISITIIENKASMKAINNFIGIGYAKFLASDLKNITFSNEFSINVTQQENYSNSPPNCTIPNITLVKDYSRTIDFKEFCNDNENQTLNFNLSADLNFTQENSLFTFIPKTKGTFNATLIVNDSKNISQYCLQIQVKEFLFNISTNKQQYLPGEETYISINAPNNSIVNLTLTTPSQQREQELISSFPITYIYYGSEEGTYSIKAKASYYYANQEKNLNFTIKSPSNLTASIDSVSEARTIDTITIRAIVSGNYGSVSYEWDLNNDNITDSNSQNITYNFRNTGTANVRLKAKDTYKEVTVYKQIRILGFYDVAIIVNDENGEHLNAVVSFNNETKNTQNGSAVFKDVLEGEHKVYISKDGYYDYESYIVVSSNKTVEVQLAKIREKPRITIIEPENNYVFGNKNISIKFSVSAYSKLNCILYLKSIGDWWIEKSNLKNIEPNSEAVFELNLEEGNYTSKIECSDGLMSSASNELNFKINLSAVQLFAGYASYDSVSVFDDSIEEIDNSISYVYSLNTELLETLVSLNIVKELENYKKDVERARRDYFDLRQKDLNQSELENQSAQILKRVLDARTRIVTRVVLKDVASFIKYPTEEDIYNVTMDYYQILKPKAKYSEYKKLNEQAQSLATVTTRVERIAIERKNFTEEFYLIRKTINPSANLSEISLIQKIPKSIVNDASKIRFLSKTNILQQDPLIEFKISELENNIATYLINLDITGEKNMKDFEEIKDVFVLNKINPKASQTTGMAIIDLNRLNLNSDAMSLRIFVVVLLLLVFLFLSLEINPILLMRKGRNVEKQIFILLDQAKELMQHAKYDEAASIYYEIKLLYNLLSFKQKEALYEDIKNFYDSLNAAYLEQLLEEAQTSANENRIQDAKKFLEYCTYVYQILPQELKEMFSKKYENLKKFIEQK
ncbi:MAG: hypothetical protein ACP5OZ_02995 [Candidatus Woesearchaeota archaeon]